MNAKMMMSMKSSKDNVLLSALLLAGVTMIAVGTAMANAEGRNVMDSASSIVRSVGTPTPTAMQPILYREPAIIVRASRITGATATV